MKIIVCVKQVPDTNEVRINQETGTLIREGVPSIINPDDKNALEAALVLKDETGAKVSVVSMGPPQATDALKEAIAMGADHAYLVSDRAFGGSDTWESKFPIAVYCNLRMRETNIPANSHCPFFNIFPDTGFR